MQIEQIPINELTPYTRNSRTHSAAQVDQIAASITEFGFCNPVLIDAQGEIIAGHGRVMAAKQLNIEQIPCIRLGHLTDAQKRAYVIADNKLAENAGWDENLLQVEIEALQEMDFSLDLLGFDAKELEAIMPEEPTEGLTDPDEIPEPPPDPTTKLGDIWLLGNHRLMCGDSTSRTAVEALMAGEKADMVFTDPPYGYKYESNHYKKGNPHGMLKNDEQILDFLSTALPVTDKNSPFYIFCGWQNAHEWRAYIGKHKGLKVKNLIIWKKNNWSMGDLKGAYAGQYEMCVFAHKGRVELAKGRDKDVWECDREPAKLHPTTKPVELATRAIGNHACKNILDLFGGSGSTLIGCEKTGRCCYCMEITPKYCDVIITRWQNYTGKTATLQATGKTYAQTRKDRA